MCLLFVQYMEFFSKMQIKFQSKKNEIYLLIFYISLVGVFTFHLL